jgi:hypothetical protein
MSPRLLRPRRAGGAAFDPSRLAGLQLWLDASDTSSLTFNGSTVSEWRDLSGNGRHYSQSTAANQPNGTGRTQNGRRVLDFTGSSRLVGNAATLNLARNIGALSVFAVAKFDDTSPAVAEGGRYVFMISRSDNATSARIVLGCAGFVTPSNGFTVFGRRNDADVFASAASASDTNPHVLHAFADYANTTARLFVDGTNTASNTSFLTAGNTQNANSLTSSIGFDGGTANHLDGFAGEVVVFQRVLSTAERQALELYLGQKWGISVA